MKCLKPINKFSLYKLIELIILKNIYKVIGNLLKVKTLDVIH